MSATTCGPPGCRFAHPGYVDESNLLPFQILHLHPIPLLDDLSDPAAVAVLVVALIAEQADRAALLHQGRQLVEAFLGLWRLQVLGENLLQRRIIAAARGEAAF